MAKKTANQTATRRKRRSPEQIIADLQSQIRDVKARAATKELKQSAAVKKSLSALRSMDKSMDLAHEEGNSRLHHALADARRILAEHLQKEGMRLPKARMPRGRKPKSD